MFPARNGAERSGAANRELIEAASVMLCKDASASVFEPEARGTELPQLLRDQLLGGSDAERVQFDHPVIQDAIRLSDVPKRRATRRASPHRAESQCALVRT